MSTLDILLDEVRIIPKEEEKIHALANSKTKQCGKERSDISTEHEKCSNSSILDLRSSP